MRYHEGLCRAWMMGVNVGELLTQSKYFDHVTSPVFALEPSDSEADELNQNILHAISRTDMLTSNWEASTGIRIYESEPHACID